MLLFARTKSCIVLVCFEIALFHFVICFILQASVNRKQTEAEESSGRYEEMEGEHKAMQDEVQRLQAQQLGFSVSSSDQSDKGRSPRAKISVFHVVAILLPHLYFVTVSLYSL